MGTTVAPAPSPAAAATPDSPSPLLPPGHWAVRAAERAVAMDLLPEYMPGQRAVPRDYVGWALRLAASRAVGTGYAATARGWAERFDREYGRGERVWHAGVEAGLGSRRGATRPGTDEFPPDATGAIPIDDATGVVAAGDVTIAAGRFGAHAAARVGPDGDIDRAGELIVRLGLVRISIGRAPIGWGTGRGGGVVFSGAEPIDRIEISSIEAVRLPWLFRYLGPFGYQVFAGPMLADRHPGEPWLMGATASARPHHRVTLSGHRALMGGGDGIKGGFTAPDVLRSIIGQPVVAVNQIASTSIEVRLPTERVMPIAVYCEWGAEDSAGAPFSAPGLICGGRSASLPGLAGVGVSVEHAQFGTRPANGPPWYRHHMFPGNWVFEDAPMGHALGGEGRQWRAVADVSALAGVVEASTAAFQRTRTGENMYVPGRGGVSRGVSGVIELRAARGVGVTIGGYYEDGDSWRESGVVVLGGVRF